MAITRSAVEREVTDRCTGIMTVAGLTADDDEVYNRHLNGPFRWALDKLGIAPADPGFVQDSDLSVLANSRYDVVVDLVEIRLLQNCQSAIVQLVNVQSGPIREDLGGLLGNLDSAIKSRIDAAEQAYDSVLEKPIGGSTLRTATFRSL